MKTIFRIGKLELRTLFYSPIAWLLLIAFTIHLGWTGSKWLNHAIINKVDGNELVRYLFSTEYGLLGVAVKNLYLYIPLLTMGLMSREISSGSIKLLLSSPVRIREMIFGKFLAIMIYWLILSGILMTLVIALSRNVEWLDYGVILSGLLAFYLLACAYSAIGLFMSCLTSYQVVAAVSTLIILAILNFIGGMWQDIPFARDISWFLNMDRHTMPLLEGLIVSKDVLYFIIMTVMFLLLSIFWLQDTIQMRRPFIKTGRYVLLICGLLIIGYLGSRRTATFYYDATFSKKNTLTKTSQEILKQIKGPVKITHYVNLLDAEVGIGMPSRRNENIEFWERYIRFVPGLELEYVNYYDTVLNNEYIFKNKKYKKKPLKEIAEIVAEGRNWDIKDHMPPTEIRKIIDLSSEGNNMVRQLEYNGKKTFLRTFADQVYVPTETEITIAFKKLITDVPKLAFVNGHNERSYDKKSGREYKYIINTRNERSSLINRGFDVVTISLDKEIPAGISALVIADPTTPFNEAEINKIHQYIAAGGNLMITTDPGREAIINPLIDTLQVQLMPGTLIQDNKDLPQDMIYASFSPEGSKAIKAYEEYTGSHKIFMAKAAGLQYKNGGQYAITPVLETSGKDTYIKLGEFQSDTGKVSYDPTKGDLPGTVPVALALTRQVAGKQQRIMIIGDADFMSSENITKDMEKPRLANLGFTSEMFKWFAYGAYPLDGLNVENAKSNKSFLDDKSEKSFKIIFFGIIPVLLFLWGATLLISRKRK